MLLPASQAATLALLAISLICWGIWANTLKLAGKWRFEFYFYDFALGFALLAVVAAFTGGSLASSELTFQENFLVASYRNVAYVLVAGIIFNVGNMLSLTATISVSRRGLGVHAVTSSGGAHGGDSSRSYFRFTQRYAGRASAASALLLAAAGAGGVCVQPTSGVPRGSRHASGTASGCSHQLRQAVPAVPRRGPTGHAGGWRAALRSDCSTPCSDLGTCWRQRRRAPTA